MIVAALKQLFASDNHQQAAHSLYVALVNQSRSPWFYAEQKVPDTLDGRFDVIMLHLFLVMHRLGDAQPELVRALSETFIADMDRSLREMGVSDTGVGKRVKKMIQAYYGRMKAYSDTVDNREAFTQSLTRNLYRSEAPIPQAAALYAYMQSNLLYLKEQSVESLSSGLVQFKAP
ncbi:MAG: ubiquinol-cytochrome C chaperone family protein [Rickettsiales bacterium]|nr:ubiquinol-cytochrome C chaperone family protein [Rickettsiales bacterium]